MGTRNPATCLESASGKKVGASGVSNITAKEQMPTHTPHSSQLENFMERILKVSFSLGLTVLSWNRNQEGVLLEGWGKEAGPEESEGEDRNSLWFASSRPLPGWRWWLLPLNQGPLAFFHRKCRETQNFTFSTLFYGTPTAIHHHFVSCCFSSSGSFLPHNTVDPSIPSPHSTGFFWSRKKDKERSSSIILKICIYILNAFKVLMRTVLNPSRWGSWNTRPWTFRVRNIKKVSHSYS